MKKLLFVAALLVPTAASAQSWFDSAPSYGTRYYESRHYYRDSYGTLRYYRPRRTVTKYVTRHPKDDKAPVSSRSTCYPLVRVVGSQWKDEDGAEDSARKGWMESIRWQYGEQAMDIGNARDYAKRCSRSSVGSVLGETLHRCEVEARPCRPFFEDGK
jgi:hypothetical protein